MAYVMQCARAGRACKSLGIDTHWNFWSDNTLQMYARSASSCLASLSCDLPTALYELA
jgi:hypothetical protein